MDPAKLLRLRNKLIRRNLLYYQNRSRTLDRSGLYQAIRSGLVVPDTFRLASHLLIANVDLIEAYGDQALWALELKNYLESLRLQAVRAHLLISLERLSDAQAGIEHIANAFPLRSQKDPMMTHILMARYLTATGSIPAALSLLHLLLVSSRHAHDLAYVRNLLAVNYFRAGDHETAHACLASAIYAGRKAQDRSSLAIAYQNRAIVLARLRQPLPALKAIDQALQLLETEERTLYWVHAQIVKGWLLLGQNRVEPAVMHLRWLTDQLGRRVEDLPFRVRWKLDQIHRYLGVTTPFYFPYRDQHPRQFSWQLIEVDLPDPVA